MLNVNVLLVMWRELFEAALVVTIVHAFLIKRLPLSKARSLTGIGVAIGVAVSLVVGLGFVWAQDALSGDALDHFQTGALLVCAALMTQMCIWMKVHARHLKSDLEQSMAGALSGANQAALLGLIALAITREGFEAVVFLYGMALSAQQSTGAIALSAGLGVLLALVSSACLTLGVRFVSQKVFFKVTGVFLLITAASMVLAAVDRLIQAGLVERGLDTAWDTSWLLDERSGIGSVVASITGYRSTPAMLSVLAYAAYWIIYFLSSRVMTRRAAAPAVRPAVVATAMVVGMCALHGGDAEAQGASAGDKLKLKLSGYGDMHFSHYDYGADRTLKDGAAKDSRLEFDATRFVTRLEGFYIPYNVEFEAEVEFEHGGTGAAKELEYEESGEYEKDVEKGGEVLLEEFYLKKYFDSGVVVSAGRIKVAMGLLALADSPLDYLAVGRSEAEVHLLPESWNEMGAEAMYEGDSVRLYAQFINGLDSSGFSSEWWVASGHQGAFETTKAGDPAGVLRFDYTGLGATVLGVSGYYGGTSRNRPKADLVKQCGKSNDKQVAACGYIEAPVIIADAHAAVRLEKLRANADVVWGQLKNAGKVSERNLRLSSDLGAARSPVADEALGWWTELGYDVAPALGMANEARLEPFARYDYYDTMFKTKGGQVDNPRWERRVITVGGAYTLDQALFAKLDVSRRAYGADHLRPERTIETAVGFNF